MSPDAPPFPFTVLRAGHPPAHYALVPPAVLARAFAADPLAVSTALLERDPTTIRIQARAAARWGRWYGHRLAVPLHPWWATLPGAEDF